MGTFYHFEILITLFVQNMGVWLNEPMKAISFLGQEEFFLILMPALYWCVDSTAGFRIALMLLLTNGINGFFKFVFHGPRPYWFDEKVTGVIGESSFGIPSGHSQNSAAIWGLMAAYIRKRWFTTLAVIVVILIGFSRLVLGVHFLQDILSGWLIGLLLLYAFIKLEKPITAWVKKQSSLSKVLLSIASALLLVIISSIPVLFLDRWVIPDTWIQNALADITDEHINPLDISGAFTVGGTWLGMTLGYILLNHKLGGFKTGGVFWKRFIRYLVGMIGVVALWYGLGLVFPRGEDWIGYILRFFRYSLIGFWVAAAAPWIFQKLKLAYS